MAEYLIQDTSLEAIADAINAKTGGSSAMTPAQMVTAIGSISGGTALLAQYVASEPVNAGRIDFTQSMLGYDAYYIFVEGTPSRIEYPCPAFNEEPTTKRYGPKAEANVHFAYCIPVFKVLSSYTNFSFTAGGVDNLADVTGTLQYFKVMGYYTDNLFSNLKISVYGVNFS